MRTLIVSLATALAIVGVVKAQSPLETSYVFTYQGQVTDAGSPANGTYDLRFSVHNEPSAGDQYGSLLCFDDVPITDGHVTQALDFGNVFFGEVLWLEVSLRASSTPGDCGSGVYTTLTPRQQLTIAPFAGQAISALSATNASSLAGLTPTFFQNAGNISAGVLSDARLSSNVLLGSATQTITGAKSFSNDLTLLNDDATITFSAADATNSPMIQMFASGASNGTRMVLAHSPTLTTSGLRYNDTTDDFEFANLGASKLGVHLATGRLRLDDPAGGLSVNFASAMTSPLITLFPSESASGLRYLFAESAADGSTNFGYDAATDSFSFLFNGGDQSITFDVPNGRMGLGVFPQDKLDLGGTPGLDAVRFPDGSRQTSASLWRSRPTGMSFTGGNVGVGIEDPTSAVHLVRDLSPNTIRFQGVQVTTGGLSASNSSSSVTIPLGSGVAWTNSANGSSVNGQFTTASFAFPSPTTGTRTLKFSNLNLNIPANATITKVTVQMTANASGTCTTCQGPSTGVTSRGTVRLTDGTIVSPPRYGYGGVGGTYGNDGYSPLWNMALTPAVLNSPNFAILYDAEMFPYSSIESYPSGYSTYECTSCTATGTVNVDGAVITVEYGAPVTASTDFSIGVGPGSADLRISPNADLSTPSIAVNASGQVTMNSTNTFVLTVNGQASKPGGGSWASTSDIRLKHDIQPLSGTLDTLLSLHGYSYEYNEDEVKAGRALPGRQRGLIAQEVQQVFPDWIAQREDGYLTVTERSTTALMVESLRDLRSEKDQGLALLQQQIDALKEQIAVLRQENEAMRQKLGTADSVK